MNKKSLQKMGALALTTLFLFGANFAFAEDPKNTQAQDHKEHHPEEPAAKKGATDSKKMGKMDMNQMDMNQMMDMMHECMKMHNDGKMCDHQTMEKCEANMSKSECKKMMSQAKKKESTKK